MSPIKNHKIKDLEEQILYILDISEPVKSKIRKICNTHTDSDFTYGSVEYRTKNPSERSNTVSESDNDRLLAQLDKYKKLLEQQKAESEKVVLENRTLNKEITELRHELETTKTESEKCKTAMNSLEKKYDLLKKHFSSPVILLDKYRSLPISIRNGLSDIICDKDEILFIASCSSPEHLKAIWNYTKALAGNNANENELNIMKEIFDYFFDVFNNSLSEPVYERDKVEPGIVFDDEKFDRCIGSATCGKITGIILRGYRSINTGAVICRSLVRL